MPFMHVFDKINLIIDLNQQVLLNNLFCLRHELHSFP